MTIEKIHDDPSLARAVHDTATKKLNDPQWEPFPIDLLGDLELGKRAFEVLETLGYAREKNIDEDFNPYDVDPEYDPWKADWIHPRAKEFLVKYGKQFVECLEAYMRLTNQPIKRL